MLSTKSLNMKRNNRIFVKEELKRVQLANDVVEQKKTHWKELYHKTEEQNEVLETECKKFKTTFCWTILKFNMNLRDGSGSQEEPIRSMDVSSEPKHKSLKKKCQRIMKSQSPNGMGD